MATMEKFLGVSLGDGPLEILFLILAVMIGVAIGMLLPFGDKTNRKDKK